MTDRATVRPHHRHTNVYSHFLATLGAQEKADCKSMLSSIDSCQNRVSTDQYHLAVSRAQVWTHRGRVFFEVIRWQFTRFQMIAGSRLLFLKIHIKYVVFMSVSPHTITILMSNWPRTQKLSQFFLKYMRGRPFLTMVTCWSRSMSNFYGLIG